MSIFRRRLMMISERYIMGIDFGKQPDNELWYITTDGQKVDSSEGNLIGGYNKQEGLSVVSHTYENGIGKVRYSADVVRFGEGTFRFVSNCLLASVPRKVSLISAFCFGNNIYNQIDYLVLLRGAKVEYNTQFVPYIKKATFVMPGCIKFYKGNFTNVIEKKLRDIEYITFENPDVERICIEKYDTTKDGKVSIDEAEDVTSIGSLFNNITGIENLNNFQHFCNVTNVSGAFIGCSNLKVANIWEGVKDLGDNLLMGATKLEKVIVPSTIRDMGQMWVRNKLIGAAVVVIKSEIPPRISDYNILNVAKTLYVPDNAVDRYKAETLITKYITNNIKPISEYN